MSDLRSFLRGGVELFRFVPESRFKHAIRKWVYSMRPSAPYGFLVNFGDTVLLIGTPRVKTMERLSRFVGPKGRVAIVEPGKRNFDNLVEGRSALGLENVILVNKAAWSEPGKGILLTSSEFAGDNKIQIDNIEHDNDYRDPYDGEEEVVFDTVDNILEEIDIVPKFVFVAVNGAEIEVLKGMSKALSRPLRVFVKGHARFKDGDPINGELSRIISDLGYDTITTAVSAPTVCQDHDWKVRAGDVYAVSLQR